MSTTARAPGIVVVGAGIVGLCTAWHLLRRGAHVTVIDRDEPGRGCSYGNSGAVSPVSVVPLATPGVIRQAPQMLLDPAAPLHIPLRYWPKAAPWLIRFVEAARPGKVELIADALAALLAPSLDRHREMLAELGAGDLLRETGQLYLYRDEAQLAKDAFSWRLRERHGVRVERLGEGALRELEPAIGPAYRIGMFMPASGSSINPFRHAQVVAEAVARSGGRILRDEVARLDIADGRIRGVTGKAGSYEADSVVVCAGAWSARLLRPLGYRVPLESQRGYHVTIRDSGVEVGRPIVPADRKVFITSQETGLRVGGTVEIAGLDAPPTPKRIELLYEDLRQVFPQARTDGPVETWMGHRPCLPDSLPVIGPSARHPNLWFGFGHGHLGLTESAVTGDILARAITGEPSPIDLAPFAIERFGGA